MLNSHFESEVVISTFSKASASDCSRLVSVSKSPTRSKSISDNKEQAIIKSALKEHGCRNGFDQFNMTHPEPNLSKYTEKKITYNVVSASRVP